MFAAKQTQSGLKLLNFESLSNMWFPFWSERMYQNCTYLFFFDRLSDQASYFFLVIEPFQSFCLQTWTDCFCVLVHVNLCPHITTTLYINSEKVQSNFRKKLKIAWKVLMLNSGHSSFVTRTVRMSRFHRDNFQRGTEWSSFLLPCCESVYCR